MQGLTYTVQFSPDLSVWQASGDVPTMLADDDAAQIVGVSRSATISGQEVRFFRVRGGRREAGWFPAARAGKLWRV